MSCSASSISILATPRLARLHQLSDELQGQLGGHPKWPSRQRPALREHRLELIQARQVLALPEEPDWNRLAPLVTPFHGGVEIGRVVAALVQLVGTLLEEVVGVVVVERHARAEGVDQGEAL